MRFTGIFLTVGTTGFGMMALVGADPANMASAIAASSIAPAAKFGVGFTLAFHYLGAIRHTIWDKTAKGFSNATMLQTSYGILGASTLIALGLAMYSSPPPPSKKKKM